MKKPLVQSGPADVVRLERALALDVDFAIGAQPIRDAFGFIEQRFNVEILIDGKPLKSAALQSVEVKQDMQGCPLRTALRDLLVQYGKPIHFELRYKGTVLKPFGGAK